MIFHKRPQLLVIFVLLGILVLFPGCQSNSQAPAKASHVHNWQNATCIDPKICSTCGLTSGSASGHRWEDATCTAPKFCTNCGTTIGYPLEHDWKDATYNSPQICRRCGITQGSAKELTQVLNPVYTVTSTSTYSGDKATHGAYNLLDGDLKTNWTEGVDGNGEGEYVDFYFDDTYLITSITIHAGNHASPTAYEYNSRPKDIGLVFDDIALSVTLKDAMVGQTITFEEPIWTSCLAIGIVSVYPGSKWEDTVISEVSFTAYK